MNSDKPRALIVDYVCAALLPLICDKPAHHLDVRAGLDHLIQKLKVARPKLLSEACDYPLRPELDDVPAREANLRKHAINLAEPEMVRYELEKEVSTAKIAILIPVWIQILMYIQPAKIDLKTLPAGTTREHCPFASDADL
jgi:hypothetical protein